MASSQPQRVVVAPIKNVGVSIILTVLFGPLGMFYSTIWGGVVMTILTLFVGFFSLGIGLIIMWPICIVWGAIAARSYNKRMLAGM